MNISGFGLILAYSLIKMSYLGDNIARGNLEVIRNKKHIYNFDTAPAHAKKQRG